ncbi:hypothetical protein PR202_ga22970 [Eleusine coracana subsp. coracana]|uniref:Uncharacterized protein n=1 Tax=Eleusine coracana subsp. coracana TaxID=191504 RepID=A0AAV5D3Z3_ELECO|nr:hypothetical protein PR202_ga22970 [Eleusine coracana subsp. coracana]
MVVSYQGDVQNVDAQLMYPPPGARVRPWGHRGRGPPDQGGGALWRELEEGGSPWWRPELHRHMEGEPVALEGPGQGCESAAGKGRRSPRHWRGLGHERGCVEA